MLKFIKQKLDLIRFIRRPLKIDSIDSDEWFIKPEFLNSVLGFCHFIERLNMDIGSGSLKFLESSKIEEGINLIRKMGVSIENNLDLYRMIQGMYSTFEKIKFCGINSRRRDSNDWFRSQHSQYGQHRQYCYGQYNHNSYQAQQQSMFGGFNFWNL